MTTCLIVDSCLCFMKDNEKPVLIFEQKIIAKYYQ